MMHAVRVTDEAKDILGISKFSYEHGGLALIDYLDVLRESRSVTSDSLNAYTQTWTHSPAQLCHRN
jgi:cobalt-zinc-cadmium efflux system outer membrane protein